MVFTNHVHHTIERIKVVVYMCMYGISHTCHRKLCRFFFYFQMMSQFESYLQCILNCGNTFFYVHISMWWFCLNFVKIYHAIDILLALYTGLHKSFTCVIFTYIMIVCMTLISYLYEEKVFVILYITKSTYCSYLHQLILLQIRIVIISILVKINYCLIFIFNWIPRFRFWGHVYEFYKIWNHYF